MNRIKLIFIYIVKPYNPRWQPLTRITVGTKYFWLWQLYSLVITCIFFYGFVNYIQYVGDEYRDVDIWLISVIIGLLLLSLYTYHFVANIGMAIKRLHNAGLSHWNMLWLIVPCLGFMALSILLLYPSSFFNAEKQ